MTDQETELLAQAATFERLAAEARDRAAEAKRERIEKAIAEKHQQTREPTDAEREAYEESYRKMQARGMDDRQAEDNPDLSPWQRAAVAANRMLTRERTTGNPEVTAEKPKSEKPSKPKRSKADAQRVADRMRQAEQKASRGGKPTGRKPTGHIGA